MAYEDRETSVNRGAPVELYRITYGNQSWTYTSSDAPTSFQGEEYRPAFIQRSEIRATEKVPQTSVTVTTAADLEPFEQLISQVLAGVMAITIYRRHRGDSDSETATIWKGRILGATFEEQVVELTTESVMQALGRQLLRGQYHPMCRHALYDYGCGIPRQDYRVDATIDEVGDRSITASHIGDFEDGYFSAGYVVVDRDYTFLILSHTGSTIYLQQAPLHAEAGGEIVCYAGCDHTMETCQNKFNNLLNYGGFPYIPDRSPFDGTSIMIG